MNTESTLSYLITSGIWWMVTILCPRTALHVTDSKQHVIEMQTSQTVRTYRK